MHFASWCGHCLELRQQGTRIHRLRDHAEIDNFNNRGRWSCTVGRAMTGARALKIEIFS
jgi:hypothetical protein